MTDNDNHSSYHGTELITTVKKFKVQWPVLLKFTIVIYDCNDVANVMKLFAAISYYFVIS